MKYSNHNYVYSYICHSNVLNIPMNIQKLIVVSSAKRFLFTNEVEPP